ncbi:hypothetical protein TIFTF001_033448 [Ficus carica]|uniref:Beta-glucosidase n=1 Tax=Ficus carica TaxID=3494 RepID=A0AA88J7M6_FICCA|nr:hypothetical protein TIFTF001_033448 [Ficus carica]
MIDFMKTFNMNFTELTHIEGAGKEGGRGPSIWDTHAAVPGHIRDGNNSLIAIDSYHRFKEDIKLMKDLGVDSYRFSISWPRILPNGTISGGINQEGIDFYNNVINELLKNGIKPFVTMLHFDTPQALEDKYGGFLNRTIVDDFKDYSELLFKTYGDRVKYWVTVNEPFVVALAYDLGKGAPGRCSLPPPIGPCPAGNSSTEPYIVGHHFLLAHATAARLYQKKFQAQQGGQIGLALVGEFMEPLTDSPDNKAAAERYLDFLLGWYVEPLVFGDYPKTMRDNAKERLPTLTEEEKILSEGGGYVYSYPQGLQKLMEFMKQKYNNPTIYITENGIPEANVANRSLEVALNDQDKIDFIRQHLYHLNRAMKNGVNVKGYFYWSLFDNFEWGSGYNVRFGLYFIDYNDNYRRIPKLSAKWLPAFLKGQDTSSFN